MKGDEQLRVTGKWHHPGAVLFDRDRAPEQGAGRGCAERRYL